MITYIRRIIKSPSDAVISDSLIIDYINRFYISDIDARVQLYDFKTIYQFQCTPGVTDYNMPLYAIQTEPGPQNISYYPIYQGFFGPCSVNSVQVPFNTQRETYFNWTQNSLQPLQQVATGDGSTTTFQFSLPYFPAIPGHVDMQGMLMANKTSSPIFVADGSLIPVVPITSVQSRVFINYTNATGQNVTIQDSGQFLNSATDGDLYGLLMSPQNAPLGGSVLGPGPNGTYSMTANTINYNTGVINVTFPSAPQAGVPIQVQGYFYEQGIPRSILYYNNTITLLPSPNTQYLVELGAYLSPAAFLSSAASVPFSYMSEYIARGAARKILSDTGDVEQFMFYEPLFREQELLVWKRSQREFTSSRTQTIFSENQGIGLVNNMGIGGQS